MSEKRSNWGVGCLGAIVGWLLLSALTTATFVWLLPEHPTHPVMIFNFKIVEGAILGAVSALVLAWTIRGEPQRAGWISVIWSFLLLIYWCAILGLDVLLGAAAGGPSERIALGLSWGGASVVWAVALLLWGCVLLRRNRK